MTEDERKELEETNRELMLANAVYNDLSEKVAKIGERIFRFKKKIDKLLDGE